MRHLVVLAALVALAAPAAACADADPASDYLYSGSVFLPYQTRVPAAEAAQLRAVVAEARKAGYPIKVAIIGSKYDLGGIGSLWRQPRQYARFLGAELLFLYKGRLLIVMPNGFGLSKGGKAIPVEERALGELQVGTGGTGLASSATEAVRTLAAQAGHPVKLPPAGATASKGSSSNRDRVIIAAVVLFAGLIWAAVFLRRRRGAVTEP
jgi:hypothetical protein